MRLLDDEGEDDFVEGIAVREVENVGIMEVLDAPEFNLVEVVLKYMDDDVDVLSMDEVIFI